MIQTFRVGRTRRISAGEQQLDNTCGLFVIAILAVLIPCFAIWAENERFEKTIAYKEATKIILNLPNDQPDYDNRGRLVHFQTDRVSTPDRLGDPDFQLPFHNSLRLERAVEYCQWQEHSHDRKEKDRDGNDVTYRTYTYTKGWHTHRIPSMLFDQPGAHHNPQRDPFPRTSWQVNTVNAGGYKLSSELISRMSWFNRVSSFGSAAIREFMTSPAADTRGDTKFRYVGQGYFYSNYEASGFAKLVKTLVEFAEGSLFDYQLGDLFSSCTAGDIRVSYSSVEVPSPQQGGMSVIGQVLSNNKDIAIYSSSRDYQIGLVSLGVKTAKEMFDEDIKDHFYVVLLSRLLIVLWSFGILLSLRANSDLLGPLQLTNIFNVFNTWYLALLSTLFIAGSSLGVLWTAIWGISVINVLVVAGSLAGLYVLLQPNFQQTPLTATASATAEQPPSASEEKQKHL